MHFVLSSPEEISKKQLISNWMTDQPSANSSTFNTTDALFKYRDTEYRLCHQKNWFRSDGKGRIICNYTYSETCSYKTLMQEKCFSATVKKIRYQETFSILQHVRFKASHTESLLIMKSSGEGEELPHYRRFWCSNPRIQRC